MQHDQWLLMAGAALLYLCDSALLLFHNEVVLQVRRRGCLVSTGSALEFAGRRLFVPNPLLPDRVLARLSWPQGGSPDWRPARWRRLRLALLVIAPWTWLLLGLFWVVLPITLRFGTDTMLLGWLLTTYLTIAVMMAQVYRHRKALGLPPRAVLALTIDAFFCAPFALNIIRKISLRQSSSAPLRTFTLSELSVDENAALAVLLSERIRISLDHLEPGSEASNALITYLDQYKGGAS